MKTSVIILAVGEDSVKLKNGVGIVLFLFKNREVCEMARFSTVIGTLPIKGLDLKVKSLLNV